MNIGIVPARLNSARLHHKILADLNGKPMVAHVMERVLQSKKLDKVILAIDSKETLDALKEFNFEIIMTSPDCSSGTDRIAEVIMNMPEVENIINIQADEPLIEPSLIDMLVDSFDNKEIKFSTIVTSKLTVSDLLNPNVVKAIVDEKKNAIEFKRNIFDYEIGGVYRHIGVYGYRRNELFKFSKLEKSSREMKSNLEQLRALDNNMDIHAVITNCDSWSVDTKEDLEKVSKKMNCLNKNNENMNEKD